jgi:CheY-like chemotaxis protein
MPRMNGLEFLDAIRDDTDLGHSVVYLLITDDTDKERFAAYSSQPTGYISKKISS